VNLSPYCIANKIFHVTVLLLIYFGDQYVASEICRRRHVTALFVNNQHDIKRRGQDFDTKCVYLKGYTARRLTEEFPEKNWTKRRVNELFKMLWDTGTVNRRPGNGRPRSARTEEKAKLLLQKFPQSATDFILLIVR